MSEKAPVDTSRFAPSQDHPNRRPPAEVRPAVLDERHGYHVRVKAPDITGVGAEIYLDGIRMRYVRRWSVAVDAEQVNEVTVTFIAESVNRDEP